MAIWEANVYSIVEFIFAGVALAIVVLFLPEIIGFGMLITAILYLFSFCLGISHGKK